jgi:hypothetical protein
MFLFLMANSLKSQVKVLFSVDMKAMADSGYFLEEDRIIVRGSFNSWSGYDQELSSNDDASFLYSASFDIQASAGDTIEYKYVIISKEGMEYWEMAPDPQNPNYGNRILIIQAAENNPGPAKFDYGPEMRGRNKSKLEILQEDYMQMRSLIEENHPALYDYTSKEVLDSLFDYYYAQITDSTEYNEFYQYISAVMARIGCGHTKLFIPEAYWKSKPDHFFPLQILINKNEVLVQGYYGEDHSIPLGSRLVAINGRTIEDIIEEMLPLESSDGFIHSFKIHSIESRFPEKYALMHGFPDTFEISYYAPGEEIKQKKNSSPASFQQFMAVLRGPKELSMQRIEDHDAALITINTFGYYSEVPMFRAFIDSCFQVIKDNNIENLIIDLRGNDGGDPYCASYLFSYLEKQAVPYFIESYHHYDTLAKPIVMAENHFTGNAYALIDGGGFSTNGHFCGLLKYHQLLTFVGTDLGSTYTCTGNVMYPTLDHTKLFVGTARERRYTAAVKDMDPQTPVKPDYFVEISQEDLVTGIDGQLEYVLELIKEGR